jgi:ABC-type Fe3+ transport system substrate-binding protein
MPRRELKHPSQVEDWLLELSSKLTQAAEMVLIGSGALLWHAYQKGITEPLPENSMDVPPSVLNEFPADWRARAASKSYGLLKLVAPNPADLFIPKRKRNEPRDRAQEAWARHVHLLA